MNHFWHASAGCFLILATLAGSGYTGIQQGQIGEQSKSTEPRLGEVTVRFLGDEAQKRAYENIEVFRRLLLKKLTPFASESKPGHAGDYYSSAYSTTVTKYAQSSPPMGYLQSYQKLQDPHASVGIGPLPVEGVLLPSGIVMTAELPMPFSLPAKESESKAKPMTDWDRAQRELNGEKTDPASDTRAVHKPNVLDAVLHTLAENGHKLSGLDTNQGVTVVLTFRGAWSRQCTVCHVNVTQTSIQVDYGQSTTSTSQSWPADPFDSTANNTATDVQEARKQVSTEAIDRFGVQSKADGQNYGLANETNDQILGDLHFKQGRFQEALACYTKAGKEFHSNLPDSLSSLPNGPRRRELILRAIELQNKILQCEVALKHEDKVNLDVSQLKRWTSLLEGMDEQTKNQQPDKTTQAKKKGQSLPVKVIITASKELLDQAGEGHITFDQFKKKVSVNIVRFE